MVKKKRVKVGVIKKGKSREGNDNNSFYLSLGQGVELVKDGKVLKGIVNVSLQNPVERREQILKSPNVTNADQLRTEIEQYSSGGKLEFIKFEAFATVED